MPLPRSLVVALVAGVLATAAFRVVFALPNPLMRMALILYNS